MSKSVAVASGADVYVEPIKEDRPDFKELKEIEKQRREILLRVSFICHSFAVVGSLSSSTNNFFSSTSSIQAELPFWRILMFWSGTCLKEIVSDT